MIVNGIFVEVDDYLFSVIQKAYPEIEEDSELNDYFEDIETFVGGEDEGVFIKYKIDNGKALGYEGMRDAKMFMIKEIEMGSVYEPLIPKNIKLKEAILNELPEEIRDLVDFKKLNVYRIIGIQHF